MKRVNYKSENILRVCKVFDKRLPPAHIYRRGEGTSPSWEHILSISSGWVGDMASCGDRAGRPRPYATVSKTHPLINITRYLYTSNDYFPQ